MSQIKCKRGSLVLEYMLILSFIIIFGAIFTAYNSNTAPFVKNIISKTANLVLISF